MKYQNFIFFFIVLFLSSGFAEDKNLSIVITPTKSATTYPQIPTVRFVIEDYLISRLAALSEYTITTEKPQSNAYLLDISLSLEGNVSRPQCLTTYTLKKTPQKILFSTNTLSDISRGLVLALGDVTIAIAEQLGENLKETRNFSLEIPPLPRTHGPYSLYLGRTRVAIFDGKETLSKEFQLIPTKTYPLWLSTTIKGKEKIFWATTLTPTNNTFPPLIISREDITTKLAQTIEKSRFFKIIISGNVKELGNWNIDSGIPLWKSTNWLWYSVVYLHPGIHFYKLFINPPQGDNRGLGKGDRFTVPYQLSNLQSNGKDIPIQILTAGYYLFQYNEKDESIAVFPYTKKNSTIDILRLTGKDPIPGNWQAWSSPAFIQGEDGLWRCTLWLFKGNSFFKAVINDVGSQPLGLAKVIGKNSFELHPRNSASISFLVPNDGYYEFRYNETSRQLDIIPITEE